MQNMQEQGRGKWKWKNHDMAEYVELFFHLSCIYCLLGLITKFKFMLYLYHLFKFHHLSKCIHGSNHGRRGG